MAKKQTAGRMPGQHLTLPRKFGMINNQASYHCYISDMELLFMDFNDVIRYNIK
ncbi:hypothetical protein [Limosilactobacillus sp.]|uniref:hypothetical protein n=1 Tax=Limosilactobacillus sp. TaxID=2773925 RepID=UPI0025B94999|nr:hypothetical protein [Limosilactobacillus sp.]MCI2031493.1 hypothetical protein [Limosilactobacillus sp.]